MLPYYPARDGYPSMFEPEDTPGATRATKLQRSFADQLLAERFPMPRRATRARSRAASRRSSEISLPVLPTGNPDRQGSPDGPLVCQWHRAADGRMTCRWTHDASVSDGIDSPWWLEAADDDGRAGARQSPRQRQVIGHRLAVAILLTGAVVSTFVCFVLESGTML
jgi:hypothetical protein